MAQSIEIILSFNLNKSKYNSKFLILFQTEEGCDRFIVCGEIYTEMREEFVEAALNEDAKKIVNLLQVRYVFKKCM